jgi:hypothetical protein
MDTYKQVKKVVEKFSAEKKALWGYSYTSGYYESLVVELLTKVSEADRKLVLGQLEKSV